MQLNQPSKLVQTAKKKVLQTIQLTVMTSQEKKKMLYAQVCNQVNKHLWSMASGFRVRLKFWVLSLHPPFSCYLGGDYAFLKSCNRGADLIQ